MSERDELVGRARRQFYAGVRSGADRVVLLGFLAVLELFASNEDERKRWRRWAEALEAGRRVKVASYGDVELLVDDEVETMEAARALLGDDERFEAAVPRPSGQEGTS